jgi:hypothetical protein
VIQGSKEQVKKVKSWTRWTSLSLFGSLFMDMTSLPVEERQQILLYYYYAPQKLVNEEIQGLIELHSNLQKDDASSSSMQEMRADARGVIGGRIRVSPEGMNGVLSGSNRALR